MSVAPTREGVLQEPTACTREAMGTEDTERGGEGEGEGAGGMAEEEVISHSHNHNHSLTSEFQTRVYYQVCTIRSV